MNKKPHMGLIIILLMFPQIVETIYSPVLPHLVDYFGVSMASASQSLSIYFIVLFFGDEFLILLAAEKRCCVVCLLMALVAF